MSNRYTIHAILVGDTVIPGLTGQAYQENAAVSRPVTDGGIDQAFSGLMGANPSCEFTTHDVAGAVGELGLLGVTIESLADSTIAMQFKKQDKTGPASGSVHQTNTMAAGVVYPTRLSLAQGQVAAITYRIVPVSSNGLTHPVTRASNVALHTIAALWDSAFTLGDVQVNDSALGSPQGVDVDFGISHLVDSESGKPYPTVALLQSRMPTITVRHRDAAYVVPAALSGAGLEVFLRKVTNGGLPAANASEVHALLVAGAGTIHDDGTSASGFVADSTLRVHCTKPSEANVLTWATGGAIE